jgi:hypothetical protein
MEQNLKKGLVQGPLDQQTNQNYNMQQIFSIGLGAALTFFLLPKSHERAKFDISEILTAVWLVYAIYYKDYPVMVICIIILVYSLSQPPNEQAMAWP